jgi:HK97 family phage portal protein
VTGRQGRVNAEDIFHLRGPSLDGYSGLSTVAYARTSMGLASAAEEFGARFFGQGASPRGILSTEGVLKEGIASRAREQWQELYAGLGNAHKVAVLEGGLKYSPITMPLEDAQFLETRASLKSKILRAGIACRCR